MKYYHASSEAEDKNKDYFIVFILRNHFSCCVEQVPLSCAVKYFLVLTKLFKRNTGFNAQRGMKIVK